MNMMLVRRRAALAFIGTVSLICMESAFAERIVKSDLRALKNSERWKPVDDVQADGSLASNRSADPPIISVAEARSLHGTATFLNPLDSKFLDNCKITGTVTSYPINKDAKVIVYCAHPR